MRRSLTDLGDDEALVLLFLTEVYALNAARIDGRWRIMHLLMLVDMAQGDVAESRMGDHTAGEDDVLSQQHTALGAVGRPKDCAVSDQDGWHFWVQRVDLMGDDVFCLLQDYRVDLLQRFVLKLIAGEELAAQDPGKCDNLNRAATRLDAVGTRHPRHVHPVHFQGGEDLHRGRAAPGVGHAVVANQEEHRQPVGDQAMDAPGELALIGGVGMAGFVGIASEDHEVNAGVQGVVNHAVEAAQEIHHTGAQPGRRVKPAIILDTQVYIGEV